MSEVTSKSKSAQEDRPRARDEILGPSKEEKAAATFNRKHPELAAEFTKLTGIDAKDYKAVKAWQLAHNLPGDGKIGQKTIDVAKGEAGKKPDAEDGQQSDVADAEAGTVETKKPEAKGSGQASKKKVGDQGAQQIEGDDMVMQVGADGQITDAEADAAKDKLSQKIRNTERAIQKGARDALLHQIGAHADEKDESAQEKTVEAIKDPFKEKIREFIKGKALQARKVEGGGAAGRMMKNKLASEGSQMVGKVAGAVAVVGTVKDIVDAVGEAEIADFTANTWQGLMAQLDANLPPAFDGYLKQVSSMEAQTAIDAAAGETTTPWITAEDVKQQLLHLFDAIEIQASLRPGGPLKGGAIFDKVQGVLHPEQKGGEE